MDITKINSSALRNLIKLTERKEALVHAIEKIDAELAGLFSGKVPRKAVKSGPRTGKKRASSAKKQPVDKSSSRAPRGTLKKKIFAALKKAGESGMKVTDLSKKIGVKNANVHVWFSSTGKKLPEIKRLGKGHFKLEEKK